MVYNAELYIAVVGTHSKTVYGISQLVIEVRKWEKASGRVGPVAQSV